jgi:hypothetical protein
MRPKTDLFLHLFVPLAIAAMASACNFELATQTPGNLQFIVVTATGTAGQSAPGSPSSTSESAPTQTQTPTPTITLTPTITATATPIPVTMTAGQDLSCVKGPQWILYEWVASIAEGETVTLLERSTSDWPDYYYVRKSNGTECWAYGGSSTINGDPSKLPEREAPPLPEITYTIDNQTGLIVCDLFIRDKDSSVWGADRLGAGTITPGGSFSLTITAGFYDVLIKECDHLAVLYEGDGQAIGSDPNYRSLILNVEVEFYIQNIYAFDLCEFAFRPAGGVWKIEHSAADGAVATGEKVWFTLLVGYYDIQIKRCTGPVVASGGMVYIGPDTVGFP